MRTLVFPGLLHSARHNLAMGVPGVAMFEVGHVFLRGTEKLPDQPARVAGVLAGEGAGFFEAKGVVESLLAAARVDASEFRPAAEPFLYRDVTSFPPLRQDIAVIVDEDVPAGRVVDVVRSSGGAELAGVEVFDVYRGPPVPEGRKSVALH